LLLTVTVVSLGLATAACNDTRPAPAQPGVSKPIEPNPNPAPASNSISLFDGKTLGRWTPTKFGGDGEVAVENGAIVLPFGSPMTGITWTGDLPAKMDYEVSLEAKRVDGHDFFCGMTVPYGDVSCSLIVGGWGGSLVGISSLDDHDASENDTSTSMTFENNRWYKIRLRVTKGKIQAFIDDKPIVNADIRDRKVGVRSEVELSRPLGFATWNTSAALRNITLTKIDPPK
jgi:hypothetical protein